MKYFNPSENELFELIQKKLDDILKDKFAYSKIYDITVDQAEKEIQHLNELKNRSVGDFHSREYVIGTYLKFINSKLFNISEEQLAGFFKQELDQNSAYILYEMLLEVYGVKEIIQKYQLPYVVTEADIRSVAAGEEEKLKQHFSSRINCLKLLARLIYAETYGQSVIDSLQYQDISEIAALKKDYIYIILGSDKYYLSFLQFQESQTLQNIQKKATSLAKENFDEGNISVTSSKENGSRITVAGYEYTDSDQNYYNERIFNLKKIDLETMKNDLKTINDLIQKFLSLHMKGKGTFMVTGPDMGVGKSTFMLSLIGEIPQKYGIGIIDPPNEMKALQKYPEKNIATLIPNPKRGIAETFQHMLKMARDYVMVSEITEAEEMGQLMNVFLRLNSGGGATLHSFSPYEVVPNTRNLLLNTTMYHNENTAESDIARGLDMIFHLRRLSPDRIVLDKIVEVIPLEAEYHMEPVKGSFKEKLDNLVGMLQIYFHRKLVNQNYRYNTIIEFREKEDDWKVVNLPSERYLQKIGVHVSENEIQTLIKRFKDAQGMRVRG